MLGRSLKVWLRRLVVLRFSNYGYCALTNFLKIAVFEYWIIGVEIWLKFEYLGRFKILSFCQKPMYDHVVRLQTRSPGYPIYTDESECNHACIKVGMVFNVVSTIFNI